MFGSPVVYYHKLVIMTKDASIKMVEFMLFLFLDVRIVCSEKLY